MPSMTNPADALPSFQEALAAGELKVQRSKTDPNLFITIDHPEIGGRLTYFRLEGDVAPAICMVVANGFEGEVPCFDLGYATVAELRGAGRATELVGAAIRDHVAGMARGGVPKIIIEAVIGLDNFASQHVIEKHLGQDRAEITDDVSGLPAYHYQRRYPQAGYVGEDD